MKKFHIERKHPVNSRFLLYMLVLSLLVMSGCASMQKASMPPITAQPTGHYQVGKFVWFDLLTEDVKKAQNFYGELFGWRFEGMPSDYVVIYSGAKPIGGMVPYESKDEKILESFWLSSLSVEDVNRAVSAVKARYGKVLDGPMNVEGRGRMAVIGDPEGAELVLIHAAGGDPMDAGVKAGEFLWVDLFTRDAGKANEFYGAIAGYSAKNVKTDDDHSYDILFRGGRAYAGVVELRFEDVEPNWLPYIKVDNLDAVMSRATELGGVVILRQENVAVVADPTGGVFGIQEMKGGKS